MIIFTVDLSNLFEQGLRSILEIMCLVILVGQAGEKWKGKKRIRVLEQHNRGHEHPTLRLSCSLSVLPTSLETRWVLLWRFKIRLG